MTATWLSEACRLYILVVLVAAAAGKARAIGSFAETLEALVHLPARWSRSAAAAIATSELLVALALVVGGAAAHLGMAAALGLFLAFTAVLLVALIQRRAVNCNCFGAGNHWISAWDLVRNLLLIAACSTWLLMGPAVVALAPGEWLLVLGAAVLAFLLSTNLHWLAPLLRLVRRAGAAEPPFTLPLGQVIPAFEGRARADGRRITSSELAGQAAVLLFLSSGCPKCRGTIPELLRMLPAIRGAGVGLWIIPADSRHDISELLEGSALLEHVLVLEPAVRDGLNPRQSTPFYIFIDHRMVALASGLIGDDDWKSFVEQMKELAPGADTAA
ncbi:peroxiredoxin family protein [Pyxidicoccus caerfyrddinensis]|uniref:peroxiredoxin family protein n=1 Tax=Pyxidicoccus caerfyrddinensis TaxID=2709663 RepID=UPI0013DBCDCF|nr:MauE/DoxX family redox-associated membrane protein [Pyxidicoccus caerfyrddinensis]